MPGESFVWDELKNLVPAAEWDDYRRLIGAAKIDAFDEQRAELDTLVQLYEEVTKSSWKPLLENQLTSSLRQGLLARIEILTALVCDGDATSNKGCTALSYSAATVDSGSVIERRAKLGEQAQSLSVLNANCSPQGMEATLSELRSAVDADLKFLTESSNRLLDAIHLKSTTTVKKASVEDLQRRQSQLEAQLQDLKAKKLFDSLPDIARPTAAPLTKSAVYAPGCDPFGDSIVVSEKSSTEPKPPSVPRRLAPRAPHVRGNVTRTRESQNSKLYPKTLATSSG